MIVNKFGMILTDKQLEVLRCQLIVYTLLNKDKQAYKRYLLETGKALDEDDANNLLKSIDSIEEAIS